MDPYEITSWKKNTAAAGELDHSSGPASSIRHRMGARELDKRRVRDIRVVLLWFMISSTI